MNQCSPNQFIIHVEGEYDYIFDSVHLKSILTALKQLWHECTGKSLPIYRVPHNLKYNGLYTTKKDVEEGRQIEPNEKYRYHSQDVSQEIEKIR